MAEWDFAPLVLVIVKTYEPAGTLRVVEMFSVVDPLPVTEVGLNAAVACFGSPETLKVTVPVNPFPDATLIMKLVAPPGAHCREEGVTERAKSDAGSNPYTARALSYVTAKTFPFATTGGTNLMSVPRRSREEDCSLFQISWRVSAL